MRAPAFWWRSSPSLLALLLSPIGWIWGEIAGRRMQRSGQDADARVLCIGNFTAGGAGKRQRRWPAQPFYRNKATNQHF